MRTGNQETSAMRKALLAAAAIAVAATATAYVFGPDAEADQRKPRTGQARSAAEPGKAGQETRPLSTASGAPVCEVDPAYPKRQMRGLWIATVNNLDWPSKATLSPQRQRAEYTRILDAAAKRRFNAVFVQVRPASDAIYKSPYEPWSKFLTGTEGKDPGWDPLPFLISEAHKRGLEFHAWFNPYRAAYDGDASKLPASHPARRHPDWVVKYDNRLYYNPGLPQVREHVVKVVKDVVKRYDVDGAHFDDYFYPYPGQGGRFADQAAFREYGGGKSLAAWRRDNVNKLVAEVDEAVHETRPEVKFGISPFGIWRNKSQDPTGSRTNGMSAYDQIYADSRHWIKKGTVDYIIPQLYWPRGQANADYSVLAPWWANEVKGTGVQLYIGQALYQVGTAGPWRKPGELPAHLTLNEGLKQIRGDVYFSAKSLLANPLGVVDRLVKEHYKRPALLPLIKDLGGQAPPKPADLRVSGGTLTWKASEGARSYAVYRVDGEPGRCATADARNLVAVVSGGQSVAAAKPGTYLVTALDRLNNESAAARIKI
ncbi:family 10 glycosylhydrolase [Spongiactinospora sp. TRM90649]|uniref:glycoside hydrolase family 10 protein n=1 Tax=Spongiactinospora sp. TRM90649 TaxID=3031114 RepID=UPI0023F6A8C4|nr:family 10 glycosylhydrolase [Spongiactinospora sp. TRM90649]MDF5752014.1 family 10 glycosylhydrolase [Spongiactinospora sp. TRM90649]